MAPQYASWKPVCAGHRAKYTRAGCNYPAGDQYRANRIRNGWAAGCGRAAGWPHNAAGAEDREASPPSRRPRCKDRVDRYARAANYTVALARLI